MSVHKNEKNNTWYVMIRYKNRRNIYTLHCFPR